MEDKYTIAEGYVLPSQGKLYEREFNPHVELRSMTVREEMRRMSPSKTPYKVLADIIDNCLITKLPISSYNMCIGDYEYLLHKLRVVSYGPNYKMIVRCPKCRKVEEITVNLDDLTVYDYNDSESKSLLSLVLPVSKKTITLKYQTPKMLDDIEMKKEELKKRAKDLDYDPTLAITLQCCIDTVDGEKLNYIKLEEFVNTLSVRDSKAILKNIEEFNRKVGLDTAISHTCSQCGYDISTFFRFTDEFFEPAN